MKQVKDEQIVEAAVAFITARLNKIAAKRQRNLLMEGGEYCEGDVIAKTCYSALREGELGSITEFCAPCRTIHEACTIYQKASSTTIGKLRKLTGLVQRKVANDAS